MSHSQHPAYLHLLNSFQRAKTHLSISKLNTSLLSQNPPIFPNFLLKITKKLQTTKKLIGLTLDLREGQLCGKNLKDLSRNLLKELPDLQHLKIILCEELYRQNEYFDLLLKYLKHFRNLRIFEFTFPTRFHEAARKLHVVDLTKALKKSAPRLQEVKFTFLQAERPEWSPRFPSLQDWGLKRLVYLQKLTLSLPTSVFLEKTNGQERKLDLSPLKRMQGLRSLDIHLLDDFHGIIANELTFDPKKLFPHLKHFKCGAFYNHPTSSKGLELCASEIASCLPCLEDFGMRFKQNSGLTDKEIQRTIQCLASLKVDLSHLSVVFKFGKLTNRSADTLIATLESQKLRNLQVLCLEFIGCKGINNGFVAKLSEVIAQNMNELKSLRLRFDNGKSDSSPFMKDLLATVGYEGLTDRGVCNFGKSLLKGCRCLEFVWLEFGEYAQISDNGVKSLLKSLGKIESLKKVWFKFRICYQVSGMGEGDVREKLGGKKEVKFVRI